MSVRITCIKKANGDHENAYTAITSLKWVNESTQATGTSTREDMYEFVHDGGVAYVRDPDGHQADLVARKTAKGTRYVKTVADDVKSDNLLKLKEC